MVCEILFEMPWYLGRQECLGTNSLIIVEKSRLTWHIYGVKAKKTGGGFEALISETLVRSGYTVEKQEVVGRKITGQKHVLDFVIWKDDRTAYVSTKWQQAKGSAEEKIPFEVIHLQKAIDSSANSVEIAYLVLGGEGWSNKRAYTHGALSSYIKMPNVVIVSFENFLALINAGKLWDSCDVF